MLVIMYIVFEKEYAFVTTKKLNDMKSYIRYKKDIKSTFVEILIIIHK